MRGYAEEYLLHPQWNRRHIEVTFTEDDKKHRWRGIFTDPIRIDPQFLMVKQEKRKANQRAKKESWENAEPYEIYVFDIHGDSLTPVPMASTDKPSFGTAVLAHEMFKRLWARTHA